MGKGEQLKFGITMVASNKFGICQGVIMTTFDEIIKKKSGYVQTVHVFCCYECKTIVYSFAKTQRAARLNALSNGWTAHNTYSWKCPICSTTDDTK